MRQKINVNTGTIESPERARMTSLSVSKLLKNGQFLLVSGKSTLQVMGRNITAMGKSRGENAISVPHNNLWLALNCDAKFPLSSSSVLCSIQRFLTPNAHNFSNLVV